MDRVVLGKATTNTTSTTYSRSEKSGLFISAPGANVHNCSDGDLIFDSTSAGIVQILGRGRALVPKQVYDKGLYGEEGVITESNWNSVDRSIPRELNPKTSWVFDAILQVSSESKKIKANWNTATAYAKAGGIGESSYAGTRKASQLDNFPWMLPGLGVYDNELAIRSMIKKMWRITTIFPDLRHLTWTIKPNPSHQHGIKGLQSWLLKYNVDPDDAATWWSPEPSEILLFVPAVPLNGPKIPTWFTRVPYSDNNISFIPSAADRDGVYVHRNNLHGSSLGLGHAPIMLGNSDNDVYKLIPDEWMNEWNAHAAGRPYSSLGVGDFGAEMMVRDRPKIWRALSTAGEPYDENSLKQDFLQILSIFAWSYENFGKFLERKNPAAVSFYDPEQTTPSAQWQGRYTTTAPAGTYRIFDLLVEQDDPTNGDYTNLRGVAPYHHYDTGHLDAKYFTDFNTTSNWGYTQWRNGEVEISTGVEPPDGVPVQVWWNSISRPTGNTSTNLSFLDIRDHFAKQSTSSERLTALKPGISSVRANTYVENNEVKLRITQPSTEDTSEVYYTVFREPAVALIGGAASAASVAAEAIADEGLPAGVVTGDTILSEKSYNTTFVLNITDTNDPTFPGDNHAGRRQSVGVDWDGSTRTDYGRYYSVVFPDDFVKTKFSLDDPFRDYRDPTGRISSGFAVTLNIPEGVELSGNGHGNYVLPDEILGSDRYYGANEYGPERYLW